MTENEMVGWHHRLNGPKFEQTQGADKGQPIASVHGAQQVGHNLATELQCQLKFFFFFLNKLWEQRTLKFLYINGTIPNNGYEDIHRKSHYKVVSTIMVQLRKNIINKPEIIS